MEEIKMAMAKLRNISYYSIHFLTFLAFSTHLLAIVNGKNDTISNVPQQALKETTRSLDHYDVQGILQKLRSLAPKHKLYAVRQKDSEDYRPHCDIVVGVPDGDTCNNIMGVLTIQTDTFYSINPNVDCNNLFPGQWVCVVGFA